VDAPASVLSLVLLETGVGGLALLWLAPTWRKVRHGYEILLGTTLFLMLWGAWAAIGTPLQTVVDSVGVTPAALDAVTWSTRLMGWATVLALLSVIAIVAKAPAAGRVLGFAALAVGLASFVPLGALRASRGVPGGTVQGFAELLLGAFLLGAIWDGMILGHWYLVEKRLSNRYMQWMAWANVAAVVAGLVAVGLSVRNPVPCAGEVGDALTACVYNFSPLLSVGNLTITMGVGVLALVALIAGFNVKLANEGGRSIQASTGMFYLAVILAPAAEFAAKVRFF